MKNSVLIMFSIMVICFFTACSTTGKKQIAQDAECVLSVIIDSHDLTSYNNQQTEMKVRLFQTKLIDFFCTFFTEEELHEIAVFYSSENGTILTRKLKTEPENSKIREEFYIEARKTISQETFKKICSSEFLNGLESVISEFFNDECFYENIEDE